MAQFGQFKTKAPPGFRLCFNDWHDHLRDHLRRIGCDVQKQLKKRRKVQRLRKVDMTLGLSARRPCLAYGQNDEPSINSRR